ncbi:hypothetical protein CR513_47254, partial [Mucuna pruriens]
MKNQLAKLTSLVRQLAVGQQQPAMVAKICGIYTSMEHPIDMCPTLQETESDQPENVRAIVNSMEDNHFDQDRIKGLMQLNNSSPHRMHIKDKQVINSRLHNIQRHLSNNNNGSSRECLEFQQSVSN